MVKETKYYGKHVHFVGAEVFIFRIKISWAYPQPPPVRS